MITTLELSVISHYLLNAVKDIMKEYGYISPAFYFFNKDRPTNITKPDHPAIYDFGEDRVYTNHPTQIYASIIVLDISYKENNNHIQEIANEVIEKSNPDMFAFVSTFLYRSYSVKDKKYYEGTNMEYDPDTTRFVHLGMFIRESIKSWIKNMYCSVLNKKEEEYGVFQLQSTWEKNPIMNYLDNPYTTKIGAMNGY